MKKLGRCFDNESNYVLYLNSNHLLKLKLNNCDSGVHLIYFLFFL